MKAKGILTLAACLAITSGWQSTSVPAADSEVSREVIAVQLRKQGFACKKPESAERQRSEEKPDEATWLLTCDSARYKVKLVPKMAAKVEKLPEEPEPPAEPEKQAP